MATQTEVADYLGVTTRTLQNWSKTPGFPDSQGRGGYDIQKVVQWRLRYLESKIRSSDDPSEKGEIDASELALLEIEEKRLKNADRQLVIQERQFKMAVNLRKFAPIQLLSDVLTRVSIALTSNLDSLLPRIKRTWPDMPSEAVEAIKVIVAQCKNEAANIQINSEELDFSDFIGDTLGAESFADEDTDDGGRMG